VVAVASKTVVQGAADMWDLTIPDGRDFYITTDATAESILVHNCPAAASPSYEAPEGWNSRPVNNGDGAV